jgi:hypothetical protein
LADVRAATQAADDHDASTERAAHFQACACHASTKSGGHPNALWFQVAQYVPAHGEQDGLRSMEVGFLLQHCPGLRGDLVDLL